MSSKPDGLKPTSIYLYEASVTGTETASAAPPPPQDPEIRHAACEPHVVELCEFLQQLGAGVSGLDVHHSASKAAAGCTAPSIGSGATIIEAGSWAVVAARDRREIDVRGARAADIGGRRGRVEASRCPCSVEGTVLHRALRSCDGGPHHHGLWPGFLSDLVSLVTVLATQAAGRTLIHDWLYELRLFALEQLSGMSADLFCAIRIESS